MAKYKKINDKFDENQKKLKSCNILQDNTIHNEKYIVVC